MQMSDCIHSSTVSPSEKEPFLLTGQDAVWTPKTDVVMCNVDIFN